MAFVDAAIAVGSTVGLEGTAAAIGGTALMGAGAGALYNGVTGRNVLNGALMGGAIGGLGMAGASAFGVTGSADALAASYGYTDAIDAMANGISPQALGLSQAATSSALGAAGAANTANSVANGVQTAAGNTGAASNILPAEGGDLTTSNGQLQYQNSGATSPTYNNTPTASELSSLQTGGPQDPSAQAAAAAKTPSLFSGISNFVSQHPYLTAAGVGAGLLATSKNPFSPNYLPAYQPVSASSMGLNRNLASNYQPVRTMAAGGLASSATTAPVVDFMSGGMYPGSQNISPSFATDSSAPMSAQAALSQYDPQTNPLTGEATKNMAVGGLASLPEYQTLMAQYSNPLSSNFNGLNSAFGGSSFSAPYLSQYLNNQSNSNTPGISSDQLNNIAQSKSQLNNLASTPSYSALQGSSPFSQSSSTSPFPSVAKLQNDPAYAASLQSAANTPNYSAVTNANTQAQAAIDAANAQAAQEAAAAAAAAAAASQASSGGGGGGGDGGGGSGDGGGSGGDGGGGGGDGGGDGGNAGGLLNNDHFKYPKVDKKQQGGITQLAKYAAGGMPQASLGSYSDGGQLLKGPGDGMSDNIPATIAGKQPARLADGEFVIPADVVSGLGNGSTDAGARLLYKLLDDVRKARTGTKKQGKQIKASKYLPK
jgi:uncharacterized membrane protein YgcG